MKNGVFFDNPHKKWSVFFNEECFLIGSRRELSLFFLISKVEKKWWVWNWNRWSKIARYLPGRTDNEIKNYWRTRVQKQARQLKYDVNSKEFRDTMRYVWMPRLLERIQASNDSVSAIAIAIDSDVVQPPQSHLDPTHSSPSKSSWVNSHVASTTSISNSISDEVVKSHLISKRTSKWYITI